MVLDIVKLARKYWRDIVKLAEPIDSKKKVNISKDSKSKGDFDAYTDNKSIFININDEKKIRDSFEKTILPAYKSSTKLMYDLKNPVSDKELVDNLILDTFIFVHFHEQLHPMLCPNSREDEKEITKTLYEGIREAEPSLSKDEALYKTNNCKNLMWDFVLNTSFVSRVNSYNNENLEEKIEFVFKKNGRKIEYEPVTKYPSGILPIVYLMSAAENKTDIPISLIGAMYATMSYKDEDTRKNAMEIFFSDLEKKKIVRANSSDLIKKMYSGIVEKISDSELNGINISKNKYLGTIKNIDDFSNKDYEMNQKYLVKTITKIFDTPVLRYSALKGIIKVLSPFIPVNQKVGSPDKNTSSFGSSGGAGGEGEENDEKSDETGEGSGGGDSEDDDDSDDNGNDKGKGKTQTEKDSDSMGQTLDDLLGVLGEKENDALLGDINKGGRGGYGAGPGSGKISSTIQNLVSYMAIDEYYKKNAIPIEVRNPSEGIVSFDIGTKKVWKLIKSQTLTNAEVTKLNLNKILSFQKATGLPVLINNGNGFYRLNEYKQKETPLKSYTTQQYGIDVPDNWIILQDSSSSMGGYPFVGTGQKFDLLNRVKYGLKKGLYDICKKMRKDVNFGVVDFSDYTIYSGMDSLKKVYETRTNHIKEVSLSPQFQGTALNPDVFSNIRKDLKPGKTVYTLITDGDIYGDIETLYQKIRKIGSQKDNSFIYVEIQSRSALGDSIKELSKTMPSVIYHSVSNVKDIADKLSKVLIKYG